MPLPPHIHVLVRDWLSANNVLMRSRDGHVLVDTGYSTHATLTLRLVSRLLDGAPLAKIVNTHGHSDHVGGNAALREAYRCPIAFPDAEADAVDAWDDKALLYEYADQECPRFAVDERIAAGTVHVWGDLEWRALAAPGHDMGALVFYNPEHRALIAGDALWERGFGFVMPAALDPRALPATRATLDMIAALDVLMVIPGHGEPFTGVAAALERAYSRLAMIESDEVSNALHSLKALLMFKLLDRRSMVLAELPAYVDRVGVFRDFNASVLRMAPDTLAQRLVEGLVTAGAARIDGGSLVTALG